MPTRPLIRLRKLCLALPEAHEVEADWGDLADLLRDAYHLIAPEKLAALLPADSNE